MQIQSRYFEGKNCLACLCMLCLSAMCFTLGFPACASAGEHLAAALDNLYAQNSDRHPSMGKSTTPAASGQGQAGTKPAQKKHSRSAALKKFTPQALGVPTSSAKSKNKFEKRNVEAGNGTEQNFFAEKASQRGSKISFSAPEDQKENFIGPRRAPLPGGKQTLSQMDNSTPPEFSVKYEVDKTKTARLTVNPQNENSPLYAPLDENKKVSAAGMFLDMDVKKDLQLQMGAEHRTYDRGQFDSEGTTSQGASVGMKWSF